VLRDIEEERGGLIVFLFLTYLGTPFLFFWTWTPNQENEELLNIVK